MKSNKQRKSEIKARRRKRAKQLIQKQGRSRTFWSVYMVKADHSQLSHNNTYGLLPLGYTDKLFKCRDCGREENWTATSQKWWYEVAKGHIDSTAIHCRACRAKRRLAKKQQKLHMEEMARQTPHPHEAFFRKQY